MSIPILRDYQDELEQHILTAWGSYRNVLAVSPTGSGKTIVFCDLIFHSDEPCCAVAHRQEIIEQISCKLALFEIKHRIVAPGNIVAQIRRRHIREFGKSYVDQRALHGVGSTQTLTSTASDRDVALQNWARNIVRKLILDEGHHYVASGGQWSKVVELFESAKVLQITATPERADGVGLGKDEGGFAGVMVEGRSTKWLMDHGYLCKYIYRAPHSDLDVSDLPVTASGDYSRAKLRQRVVDCADFSGGVVRNYQRFTPGKKGIVFAPDVLTAKELAAAFCAARFPAVELDGKTPAPERARAIEDFAAGKILLLVNVGLFDEGFDVPDAEVMVDASPTESLGRYLQRCGRVLRPAEGKDHATILDCVDNWRRHMYPTFPRVWTLEGKAPKKGSQAGGPIPLTSCLTCSQPYPRDKKVCPYCGAPREFPERAHPADTDGDLTELDIDAMDELIGRYKFANMTADEFEQDMIRRRVPPAYRSAQQRKRRILLARRESLRHMVEFWMGWQAQFNRTEDELQRRFYFRTGVDLYSAFTLDRQQTDALIDKFSKSAAADLQEDN